jgi:uncharacterized protein YecE (DUF72 family)
MESVRLSANVRIGCAGWSLSSRVADSFPVEGSHLERYAAVFSAVEINSSFYRSHQPKTYARWRDSVPDDFRFSVKIPRTISHDNRLRNVDDLLDRFLSEAGELQHKLGCLLLQLPPSLKYVADDVEALFASLRQRTDAAIACEPRHASWFAEDAVQTMRRHAIGCVHADPPPVAHAEPAGFDGTAYLRLHGSPVIYRSAYDEAFIETVVARIAAMAVHADPVWCIFDNTADGAAVPNALSLMRLLR